MDPKSILQPLCAQVLLTFSVWIWMFALRLPAIQRSGKGAQALANEDQARAILAGTENPSDNFENLFEMPILFYVGMLVLLTTGMADSLDLKLAWGFVALRAIHSFIHCAYNNVGHRFVAYALSCFVLFAIWIRIGMIVFN